MRELGGAAVSSARDGWHPDAEDVLVRSLAKEMLSADAERAPLEADIASRLSGDEIYEYLLTVLGIGAKTGISLVTLVGVSLFVGDDRLDSYCGLAPRREAERQLDRLDLHREVGQHAAQESADIQLQLAWGHQEQVRRVI